MKKVLVLILLVSSIMAFANPLSYKSHSVATTDNFLSGYVNPAALGFDGNGSFTYMKTFNRGELDDGYSLFFRSPGFEYILESYDGTHQTLASGNQLGKSSFLANSYLGYSWRWRSGSFNDGDLTTSFLTRPSNYVSLGYVLTHPNDLRPQHRAGLAFSTTPMGKTGTSLELSVDAIYGGEDSDRELKKPIVGFDADIAGSFKLGGSYDIEEEQINLRVSINGDKIITGATYSAYDDDDMATRNYGSTFISFSEKSIKSYLPVSKSFLDLGINEVITDERSGFEVGPFSLVTGKETTMLSLLQKIEEATNDDKIGGIIFRNNNFGASYAKRQELLTALTKFKSKDKKVVFYYENISNANYVFAANIGDAIYLNPEGMISLNGLGGASPYIKDLLDKLGIDFYNFRSHPYKTAGNMFSETGMTEQERQVLERLYGDIYAEMIEMIEEGRGHLLAADVETIIDRGPYLNPADALSDGLVDGLVEWHELNKMLKDNFQMTNVVNNPSDYLDTAWHKNGTSDIAVIYASGSIISGKGTPGKKIGSETTAKAISDARKNPLIKGIILRIDSGGGSALASHIIAEEVRLCKEGPHKKPVIALMSGVAASGGYYISTYADVIIAEPTTITGSIGVIGMIPNFAKLSKKVGVNWSEFKFGKNATFGSVTREMSADEQEMFKNFIHASYNRFVQTVADSRGKSFDEINKVAMGQVWTGNQALKLGLVDKLGGFEVAIATMKKQLNTTNDLNLIEIHGSGSSDRIVIDFNQLSHSFFSTTNSTIMKTLLQVNREIDEYSDEVLYYKTPYNFVDLNK
ncbi:MAG: signal peptide peptidase SppA [Candidatus Cloacimonetes bacterium 4572_65]|nr:MAG: signal peptide peptidase SppA [Candidatus Cloacimonetes bacterium 4572_65]